MKKFGKILMSFLLALVLPFSMFACGVGDGEDPGKPGDPNGPRGDNSYITDNDFDYIPHYGEPEPPPEQPVYPADEGPFTAYRMEDESAEFSNLPIAYTDVTHLGFSLKFSGYLATRNTNKPGTVTTYKFNSDKSLSNVELELLIQGNPDNDPFLSQTMDIKNNGWAIDTSGIQIKFSECTQLGETNYMSYKKISLRMQIIEGENVLTFKHLTSNGGCLDYLELHTSAVITGWDPTHYTMNADDSWTVTKKPTSTETGTIVCTTVGATKPGTYTLPVLSADNGYKVETVGEEAVYSFKVKSKTYKFGNIAFEYVASIDPDSVVTFEDGLKTMNILEGTSLPEKFVTPDGKTIAGWYEKGHSETRWTGTTFVMPARDIILTPYFTPTLTLDPDVAVKFASGDEKTMVLNEKGTFSADDIINETGKGIAGWHVKGHPETKWKGYSFEMPWNDVVITPYFAPTLTLDPDVAVTFASGDGEKTMVLEEDGTFSADDIVNETGKTIAGWHVKGDTAKRWKGYNFEMPWNDTTITPYFTPTLTLDPDVAVTFASGGEKTKVLDEDGTFSADDIVNATGKTIVGWHQVGHTENIWQNYDFVMPWNDITITPNYAVTLSLDPNAGVAFADDSKTMALGLGAALPAGIKVPEGKVLAGWYQKGNEATKWPGDTFRMTATDITISPYYTPAEGVTVYKPKTDTVGVQGGGGLTIDAGHHFHVSDGYSGGYEALIVDGDSTATSGVGLNSPKDGFFRFLTTFTPGIEASTSYTFTYTFENKGENTLTFTVMQINSGIVMNWAGKVEQQVTLASGESITVELTTSKDTGKSLSANNNGITIIRFDKAATAAKLAISINILKHPNA